MQQTTPILSAESNDEFDANAQSPQQVQTETASELPTQPATINAEHKENHALEVGGRDGPEPTRFGDWEKAGRCIDF